MVPEAQAEEVPQEEAQAMGRVELHPEAAGPEAEEVRPLARLKSGRAHRAPSSPGTLESTSWSEKPR